jgi:hypothetical protein
MSDSSESSILRIAQDERDNAERVLREHIRDCKHHGCHQCLSLARHRTRCEKQVELLSAPEGLAEEALF